MSALESVAAQSFPVDSIEIVVVDGGSTDATSRVAKEFLADAGFARGEVISNAAGTTPSNLNAGLAWASGDVIVRLDARSRFPVAYVETIVECLDDPTIAVVGGSQIALPPATGTLGRAIARALNNRFGMGLARYRRSGAASGVVDTVYLGAFRRQQLVDAAGWNEAFITNQDFELNQRMKRHGSVWFQDGLPVGYVPRGSVRALWCQYHRFGRAKVAYWRQTGTSPQPRQLALIAGPPLLGMAGLAAMAAAPVFGRFVIAGAGLGGMVALDRLGSDERPTSLGEAVLAPFISTVVGAAWWTGVAAGAVGAGSASGPTR